MIEKFRPSSSLEEISKVVLQIDTLVDGEVALGSDEDVLEWLGVTERRRAYAASKWMTGRRTKQEKENLLVADDNYRQLLGAIAIDRALKAHDQTGSMHEAQKVALVDTIEPSIENVVARDIEMRLGGSNIERMKERLARRPKERFVAPLVISGAATVTAATAFVKIGEMSSSAFSLTPAQGGLSFIIGGVAYRLARMTTRNAPRQFGELVKGQWNTSLKPYMPSKSVKRNGKAEHLTAEDLPKWYAESHLELPINKMYRDMFSYNPTNREDIAPMVRYVLDEARESVYESYDIDLEEDKKTWPQRMMGRLALSD